MALRRVRGLGGKQQLEALDTDDSLESGQLSSVLELRGRPVRLSIDDEVLEWSAVGSQDQCLQLPFLAARHKPGCPNIGDGPSARLPNTSHTVQVRVREILSATVGEPIARTSPACCCGGSSYKVHRLVLQVVRRRQFDRCVWNLVQVVFESTSQEVVRGWERAINTRLQAMQERPRSLLVVINPYGGARAARKVWDRVSRAVFQQAGVRCKVVETQRQMHAHDIMVALSASDLVGLDGVVAVGGDGLFHELTNGIMALREKADDRSLHAATLRVGHIPAGSTDAVCFSFHGTRDDTTAALHIALGDRSALDMMRIDSEDGEHRYSVTMAAYGYLGDLLKESESLRWLGPLRYELVGAKALWRGKAYTAEIKYLPSETQNSELKQVCGVNCTICRTYRESSSQRKTNFMLHARSALEQAPDKWVTVTGEYSAVMVLLPSCRSNKSRKGVAPYNHLSDGKALLVLVKACNPLQYAHFLLELAKGGAVRGKFPYVDVVDVSALQMTPLGEGSHWNVDGELLPSKALHAQVHGAMVDVFARGPDVR